MDTGSLKTYVTEKKTEDVVMPEDGSASGHQNKNRMLLRLFFMRAAMVYQKISTHVRPLSKLHSLDVVMYCGWKFWKTLRKLIVGYNHSFGFLMKFHRNCSASGMFVFNCVPSFMEMWRKYIYDFTQRLTNSDNESLPLSHQNFIQFLETMGLCNTRYTASEDSSNLHTDFVGIVSLEVVDTCTYVEKKTEDVA